MWHGALPCHKHLRGLGGDFGQVRDPGPAAVVHDVLGRRLRDAGESTTEAAVAVGLNELQLGGITDEALRHGAHHGLQVVGLHLGARLGIHNDVIQRVTCLV